MRKPVFRNSVKCAPQPALLRYCAVYLAAYFLNIAALTVLVEYVGMPHQVAQGILVFVIAGLIFVALRFWVEPLRCRRCLQ